MERKKVVVDLHQLDLLEQKVVKATELVRSLRREREGAHGRVKELEKALAQAQKDAAGSEKERREMQEAAEQLEILREERQEIRGRVSRMLEMMAALDEGPAEARREH
jgi:predicted  nucleic acid-binding Zn-ribbon protein